MEEGEDEGAFELGTLTSVLSQRERTEEDIGLDEDAGVAGQTALSGSQIKPPALPEVHDFGLPILELNESAEFSILREP